MNRSTKLRAKRRKGRAEFAAASIRAVMIVPISYPPVPPDYVRPELKFLTYPIVQKQ